MPFARTHGRPPVPATRRRRVVGIGEVAEEARPRALEGVDRRAVDQHGGIPDGQRGAGVRECGAASDVELVAHRPVVGADLPLECDLAAPERPPASETAAPGAEEAQELPDGVHAEAARLYGVAEEVALEEPVVEGHVALGDETAAC